MVFLKYGVLEYTNTDTTVFKKLKAFDLFGGKFIQKFLFRSRHPWISVYTTRTFGIIAFKYFTSIVFYFPILLGFAICFHVLFKGHFENSNFNI